MGGRKLTWKRGSELLVLVRQGVAALDEEEKLGGVSARRRGVEMGGRTLKSFAPSHLKGWAASLASLVAVAAAFLGAMVVSFADMRFLEVWEIGCRGWKVLRKRRVECGCAEKVGGVPGRRPLYPSLVLCEWGVVKEKLRV